MNKSCFFFVQKNTKQYKTAKTKGGMFIYIFCQFNNKTLGEY